MSRHVKRFRNFITCHKPKYPEFRDIFVNGKIPSNWETINLFEYPNNKIITSRYALWNFLFLNLFEQFQRVGNYYFLLSLIVQQMIDSPVNPTITLVPLIFVLSVTAISEAVQDYMRHKADKDVNERKIDVLRSSGFVSLFASKIQVGDVVRINAGEPFPCDIVMLSCSDRAGECTVTTANLDGETSLKVMNSADGSQHVDFTSYDHPPVSITCIQPLQELYTFNGTLYISGISTPLTARNLLLRGSILKGTEFIIGAAVYTGQDTKLSLNSNQRVAKCSQVERQLNSFMIVYFVILGAMCIISTTGFYISLTYNTALKNAWYLQTVTTTSWIVTQSLLGFFGLYNSIIPISIYATIEIVKVLSTAFIRIDLDMYDSVGDNCPRVNTSDLNDELGQITHLFSDKTGTLTENDMQFRMCSVNGIRYVDVEGQLCVMSSNKDNEDEVLTWPYPDAVLDFLICMCLCHGVRINRTNSTIPSSGAESEDITWSVDGLDYDYESPSPDEKAFVEASRRYGVIFHGCINGLVTITIKDERLEFKIRDVFEFDANRKCMSVIVDYPDGSTKLLCKGAESSLLSKAANVDEGVTGDIIMDHLVSFAENGLRTLVFGYKTISQSEARAINKKLNECKRLLNEFSTLLSELYNDVETNLTLIGCTGIEDRLQDGVIETLEDIRNAGIKVWVITGDKEETAVNISHSAGHFTADMHEMRLTKLENLFDAKIALDTQLERIEASDGNEVNSTYCLIVDGMALKVLLEPVLKDEFLRLCELVSTVLCCRMSPIQKAEIVSLIKLNVTPTPITCAIGDGGNDVAMIQEAHVGIGIFGKEGRQAALSADYAFGKFRFLRILLLVHGHYFYNRMANFVLYTYYKNLLLIVPSFCFSIYNMFTDTPLYYGMVYIIYHVIMTTIPITMYGIFEQVFAKQDLLSRPHLYNSNRYNKTLQFHNFLIWHLFCGWHSLVVFGGTYALTFCNQSIGGSNGKENSLTFFGQTIFTSVWIIITIKILLMTRYFNWPVVLLMVINVLTNIVIFVLLSITNSQIDFYYLFMDLNSQPSFWLIIFILCLIALTPDIIYKVYCDNLYNEISKLPTIRKRQSFRRRSCLSTRHSTVGIAFEMGELAKARNVNNPVSRLTPC